MSEDHFSQYINGKCLCGDQLKSKPNAIKEDFQLM